MSNEPKWHCGTEDEHAYIQSVEGTFYALSIVSATKICAELNRLESENAELREKLDNALKIHALVREARNRLANKLHEAQSTTPRTDADGWISVQDRLPEHGKYVLAHYYETPLLKMINTWKYNKDNPHWTNGTFTHWMPLPEPPNQFRTSQAPTNPPEGIK